MKQARNSIGLILFLIIKKKQLIYATNNITLIVSYIHAGLSIAISHLSLTKKILRFTYVILRLKNVAQGNQH